MQDPCETEASTERLRAFIAEAQDVLLFCEGSDVDVTQLLLLRRQMKQAQRQERWLAEHSVADVDRHRLRDLDVFADADMPLCGERPCKDE